MAEVDALQELKDNQKIDARAVYWLINQACNFDERGKSMYLLAEQGNESTEILNIM